MGSKTLKWLLTLLATITIVTGSMAQQGFYIPNAGRIFFAGDSATIFSNVINKGNFGVGKNATVNFSGKIWENSSDAHMSDESSNGTSGTGGWVRFLSDSSRQQLIGGYNAATRMGASFGRLKVDNGRGVELISGSARIRKELSFARGHLFLNEHILSIGLGNPGSITGYDSSKFIVTSNKPDQGFLIREGITRSSGLVTFPIGTNVNAYTPSALLSHSNVAQDYYTTVFDSVWAGGTSGTNLAAASVNKTWQIGPVGFQTVNNVNVYLQHLLADEGDQFAAARQLAYVTMYRNNGWDDANEKSLPRAGSLTSGGYQAGGGVNMRSFRNTFVNGGYFTKLAGVPDFNRKTDLWLNAYRINNKLVRVYWNTKPEVNVKQFIVERRHSNEAGFKPVDTVLSLAHNGYSNTLLSYSMVDNNDYKAISFYRLRLVAYNGPESYSDTVAVGNTPGTGRVLLWPNPAIDDFYVSLDKNIVAKALVVYNAIGQKMREVSMENRSFVHLRGFIPGTYFVTIITVDGRIYQTLKVVVAR